MNKSENLKKVNVMAWLMVKESKITWGEAIKRAWQAIKQAAKVSLATSSTYFEIEFTKISTGEVTKRMANNAKVKGNTLLFFSITDNGFRSAVLDKIINVKPI